MVKNEPEGAIGKGSELTEGQHAFDIDGAKADTETDGAKGEVTDGVMVYSHASTSEKQGAVVRDGRGRWLPGHAPKPPAPRRKPRANEQALIAALNEALPAEKVKDHLDQCVTWAYEYRSPKLLMQVLQFHYSYTLGMPVQRSITASTKLETLLTRLGEMDDNEFDQVEQAMKGE